MSSAENREQHSIMRSQERSRVDQYDTPEAVLVGVLQIAQVLDDLTSAVDELAMRLPDPLPEECRARTCTYVTHYLAQGPKELEHEGFHAAEERCMVAQKAAGDHFTIHAECGVSGQVCSSMQSLERLALRWEERVRA